MDRRHFVQSSFLGTAGLLLNSGYENPEHGCGENLKPARNAGFTEFVIPWLKIGGRVHLSPAGTVPGAAR